MSDQAYSQWWLLHVRVTRGEKLSAAEQSAYEAGKQQLDATDPVTAIDPTLANARSALARLDAENTELRAKSQRLNTEIESLIQAAG